MVMKVCGIYQDVTNSGKTAKAMLEPNEDNVLWQVVYVNLTSSTNVNVMEKKVAYTDEFSSAKVLDMADYLGQTLGPLTGQLYRVALAGVLTAILICFLVTALYLKMTFAKEAGEIAIHGRSNCEDIQYTC